MIHFPQWETKVKPCLPGFVLWRGHSSFAYSVKVLHTEHVTIVFRDRRDAYEVCSKREGLPLHTVPKYTWKSKHIVHRSKGEKLSQPEWVCKNTVGGNWATRSKQDKTILHLSLSWATVSLPHLKLWMAGIFPGNLLPQDLRRRRTKR